MKYIFLIVLTGLLLFGAFWLGTSWNTKKVKVHMPDTKQVVDTDEEKEMKHERYTNDRYGFSFLYDKGWRIEEFENGNGVRVHSNQKASKPEALHEGASLITVDFLVVPTYAFSDIQTKVGDISYSDSNNALVDTLETPPRCLPVDRTIGVNNTIPLFLYSASLMSTPTYEVSAIVTDAEYLIVSNVVSYEETAASLLGTVLGSFVLADGVNAVLPSCSE